MGGPEISAVVYAQLKTEFYEALSELTKVREAAKLAVTLLSNPEAKPTPAVIKKAVAILSAQLPV